MEKDSLLEMRENEYNNRLAQLKKGFTELDRVNVRTIPENIFVAYFLPLFCGEETVHSRDELISYWFTIAGNNYSPVNVVDSRGNFIIQVPPLHNRNITIPITNKKTDIDYVFKEAREKSTLSPKLGENIINSSLKDIFDQLIKNDSGDIGKQWVTLFEHYGKLKPVPVEVNNQDTEDEFDY